MVQEFREHWHKNFDFAIRKKILVACSGGLDSIVLLHLLKELNCEISVAHCNFNLRGSESDDDHKFVKDLSEKLQLPFYDVSFNTNQFVKDEKISIQMAARQLRYNWFYEILQQHKLDFVATAHHADDNLETFFINISRSSGIDGLVGIPANNDKTIRPLLPFSRKRIYDFAIENKIAWREDSSNIKTDYLRNKIRHELLPVLKNIFPEFESKLAQSQSHLREAKSMRDDAAILVYNQVAQEANGEVHINLQKLARLPNADSYLQNWLQPFGFKAWQDIYDLKNSESGKLMFSETHQILKNRHFFILSEIKMSSDEKFTINNIDEFHKLPIKLTATMAYKMGVPSNRTIFADWEKLIFPLTLEHWNDGDFFYPIGMEGKRKKVSKYFKDEKISINEKDRIWILKDAEKIIWIIGHRQDERSRVFPETKQILNIKIEE